MKKIILVITTLFTALTSMAAIGSENVIAPVACGSENRIENPFQPMVCFNVTFSNDVIISLKSNGKESYYLADQFKNIDVDPIVLKTYEFSPLAEGEKKYVPDKSTLAKEKVVLFTISISELSENLIISSEELNFETILNSEFD